jgi:hypothetical protein
MDPSPPKSILVVANRTAATLWLLQEVEARALAGPCEFELLVPRRGSPDGDWSPQVARHQIEQAAGRPVQLLEAGRDDYAAIERAVGERRFDEILVSVAPPRGPRVLRRDLLRRLDALDVPVTAVVPGARPAVDQTVLKVRW